MVGVFVSYRRDDATFVAGRLKDRLTRALGDEEVFFDVDSIGFGEDFRNVIRRRLSDADIVLALIGPRWRIDRLQNPEDYVRIEITEALRLGKRVIPVLLDETEMPTPADLPADMREIVFRNAAPLRPDPDFHDDADRLIEQLHKLRTTDSVEIEPLVQPPDFVSRTISEGAAPQASAMRRTERQPGPWPSHPAPNDHGRGRLLVGLGGLLALGLVMIVGIAVVSRSTAGPLSPVSAFASNTRTAVNQPSCGGAETRFDAPLMIDGDDNTGWGVKGSGGGEQITINFGRVVRLTDIGITPGYFRDAPRSAFSCNTLSAYPYNRWLSEARFVFDDQSAAVVRPDNPEDNEWVEEPHWSEVDIQTEKVIVEIVGTVLPQGYGVDDDFIISDIYFLGHDVK